MLMSDFFFKQKSEKTRVTSAFNKLLKQIGDPVDFELPDWFNKRKSMQYTFIKRSILYKCCLVLFMEIRFLICISIVSVFNKLIIFCLSNSFLGFLFFVHTLCVISQQYLLNFLKYLILVQLLCLFVNNQYTFFIIFCC